MVSDAVKDVRERKEAAWKDVLKAKNENRKKRCIEIYAEENRRVESYIYQSKKEVNEQFGRKIN